MSRSEMGTLVFYIVVIVVIVVTISWCGRPHYVEIDGMTCIESGFGTGRTLDCDWDSKEDR